MTLIFGAFSVKETMFSYHSLHTEHVLLKSIPVTSDIISAIMSDGVKIKIKMFIISTTQCCPQMQFWVSNFRREKKKKKLKCPVRGENRMVKRMKLFIGKKKG